MPPRAARAGGADRPRRPAGSRRRAYAADLIRMSAVDQSGTERGYVVGVESAGPQELLRVRHGKESLVPFSLVVSIDEAARKIAIEVPGGLFDLGMKSCGSRSSPLPSHGRAPLGESILGKAREGPARDARRGHPRLRRRQAPGDRRRSLRRRSGMVMKPEPLVAAIESARAWAPRALAICSAHRGTRSTRPRRRAVAPEQLILVCGATRESTSGCASTSTSSCRSATSCSPAVNSPPSGGRRRLPARSRRPRQRREPPHRIVHGRTNSRRPPVHPAAGVPWRARSRGPALRRPRPHRALAQAAGARPHARPAARSLRPAFAIERGREIARRGRSGA